MARSKHIFEAISDGQVSYNTICDAALAADIPDALKVGLKHLAEFALKLPTAGLDFHLANFMVRPATGDLVISDPLQDALVFNRFNR